MSGLERAAETQEERVRALPSECEQEVVKSGPAGRVWISLGNVAQLACVQRKAKLQQGTLRIWQLPVQFLPSPFFCILTAFPWSGHHNVAEFLFCSHRFPLFLMSLLH